MEPTLTPAPSSSHPTLPPIHAMPARLEAVRHGESEANLIQRALRKGVISEYPPGFADIPDREIRLSKLGTEQAVLTGKWLREQYPDGFDCIYVSDHTRAKETAALACQAAGWTGVEIRVDPLLGERNWGRFTVTARIRQEEIRKYQKRDPLHVPMPDGESLLETRNRTRELLDRAAREFSGKKLLIFTHGEYIEALWSEIAHMRTEQQRKFFHSPAGNIKNCQVVEFSGSDPHTGEFAGKLKWIRSSCPQAESIGTWAPLRRLRLTAADLLKEVNRYPHLNFSPPS